ncbi:MAG: hypothetical protein OXN18_11500 [Gemmatimonadota bacterium]|nr:hypothetical protein [Gemmatimonadota bacterium]
MQMVRTLGAVAVTGAVSVVLLKLLMAAAIPLLGMLFGFMALAFKIGLFVAAGYLLYRMFRRRRDEMAA